MAKNVLLETLNETLRECAQRDAEYRNEILRYSQQVDSLREAVKRAEIILNQDTLMDDDLKVKAVELHRYCQSLGSNAPQVLLKKIEQLNTAQKTACEKQEKAREVVGNLRYDLQAAELCLREVQRKCQIVQQEWREINAEIVRVNSET